LLWHHNHALPADQLIAKQLLYSLEQSGMKVFPDFYTSWHFDDKLGQKYLFEALDLPAVNSYVFFSKREALSWIKNADFPLVFKLRRGAGSRNVHLVRTKSGARKIIKKAFDRGFRQYDAWGGIRENWRKYRLRKSKFIDILKALAHLWYPLTLEKAIGRERGYVYFQDFIPENEFDIRVIVIGERAFAIKRNVRKNDFRASGSGFIEYDKKKFSDEIIWLSFDIAKKIMSTCIAIDFVHKDNKPLVVEVSYGFDKRGYEKCVGYWDSELNWFPGSFNPYGWMVDNVLEKINVTK